LNSPLFVVFNMSSGHGDASGARTIIDEACAKVGRELHMMNVDAVQRIGEVAQNAVRLAKQVNGIVVAAGGDGTINTVAQATIGSGRPFGVLPQGTFNYFSRTHGIPADVAQATQVLLGKSMRPVQVGLVNDRIFLVNASLGLYPKLLEDREVWKKQLGRSRWVAFAAGMATLLSGFRNLRLTIELQGKTLAVRTPTLFVGNNALQMEQLGFPEAQAINGGKLAGITLKPLDRLSMIWLLMRGALGNLGEAEQIVNFSFDCLTVKRSRGSIGSRVKVATDGEIVWLKLPLQFRVSPQPLLLLCPAQSNSDSPST
jgi:diacylglycerol kinase family enzyme